MIKRLKALQTRWSQTAVALRLAGRTTLPLLVWLQPTLQGDVG